MTPADIERMAREADPRFRAEYLLGSSICGIDAIARFAELVAAHERERCAVVCDSIKAQYNDSSTGDDAASACAAAIRAL